MQRIGESKWRPLELCFGPEQGKLPAKGKEYPGLGYKWVRDKPPKAQQQQQPAAAHEDSSSEAEGSEMTLPRGMQAFCKDSSMASIVIDTNAANAYTLGHRVVEDL
ncbi:hypothetical protein QJQ45_004134 [Haematococcus lacustris]|nr:hypothetical protein QJQ45_004134 [Haematococcus lacustris]